MEENTNKNEVNTENQVPAQKMTLKEKVAAKKAEIKAKHEAKKAAREGKPGIGKKILAGAGIAALVVGGVAAGIAAGKRSTGSEEYDPEFEAEPGDDCELDELAAMEESTEENVEE